MSPLEETKSFIDRKCEPKAMSKQEAYDFLEEIVSHCRSSMEALREEMGEDE